MKILFFLESLHSGGAERRVVELLSYLKENPSYSMMVVLMRDEIHYKKFLELNIPFVIIERKLFKKDPSLIFKFYKICRKFRPDIIHSWGYMASFYSLYASIFTRTPLVNSQITRSLPKKDYFSLFHIVSSINFRFSKIILSNSYAGLQTHGISGKKGKVIYNGINLNRFKNLQEENFIKKKYGIVTEYSVLMVASFTNHKDFNSFIDVAKTLSQLRKDVTFIAVGDGPLLGKMQKKVIDEKIPNVVFTGRTEDVESIINIADVGVLISNRLEHGEGISNSIIEYMALGKPVIANDAGGTKEIVNHGVNGCLLQNESISEIANIVDNLISDKPKRLQMGFAGKALIEEQFALDRMGKEFEDVYMSIIKYT